MTPATQAVTLTADSFRDLLSAGEAPVLIDL